MKKLTKILLVFIVTALIAGCVEEKITPDQPINLVKMGGMDMVQRLGSGEIAGFIGWEPYPAIAITKGYGKPLMYSGDIWDEHPCCVVAYDYDWYKQTENADEILNRMALVQLMSVEYINNAKQSGSPDHEELINYSLEFGGMTDRAAAEMSLKDVEFVYSPNIPGTETFISKIMDFNIFDSSKWNQSGYKNASDYANNLITNRYVNWALQNREEELKSLALKEPVTIRAAYLVNDIHELPFYVGWQKGWHKEVGINITLSEGTPFLNGAFMMQKGFKTNAVDIGSLGIAPVIIHRINSNDFAVDDARVGVIAGMNNEGSVIVVAGNITSLADLRGKTVGFPGPGTIQHVLFLIAAEKAGVRVSY
ncbi:ABC-type nitrate/sulfonate/bicarbonate transportsystem, periplasmic component [groundwater metagenome]